MSLILVEHIWDSIIKEEINILDSHNQEVERKLSLHHENKAKWLSYQKMKDQLIQGCSKIIN